jgi:hypothetical protein
VFTAETRSRLKFHTCLSVKGAIFWYTTPCSPLKVNRRFGGTCRLHRQGRKISRTRKRENRWQAEQASFSALKMEAICSSETSADFQRTTRRYIPKDGTLHNHRCENLKSYRARFVFPCGNGLDGAAPFSGLMWGL